MKPITWQDRLRYRFDNFMSRGTGAMILGLFAISAAIILLAATLAVLINAAPGDEGHISFGEAVWVSLMRTLDAGTMGGDAGWKFRGVMFLVTLGGVFVISSLIGVLTSGVEGRLEQLRKGRSRIIENGHTVILNWSPKVFSIISELVEANANQRNSCIVVMGAKDKVEMEEEINDVVENFHHTRLVCRSGSPIYMNDLEIASLQTAKSVIVLAPESDHPDADVIKTLLAITNSPQRRKEPYHIVAEIRDAKNYEVARLVGKDEVEIVLVGDLISRIIAQTCRQSGLSIVYTELLDFGGDEIYFKEEPTLVGKTFGEALLAYEDSAVIGLFQGGQVKLNPPMDARLQPGDQLIAISEDDDTIRLSGITTQQFDESAFCTTSPTVPQPERTLILSWNWRVPTIINELDNYVAPGSVVTVVTDYPEGEEGIKHLCAGIKNQEIIYQLGDTTDRLVLDLLEIETYKHVIILSNSQIEDPQAADACTTITLLHLRAIAEQTGHPFSIVSEMLDTRNRQLAEVTQADDFIVSDKITSLMLSQVSENKQLNAVFTDIFDPEGSEIYLKPAGDYVKLGVPANFYTVVEAARRRGEVAFGYRLKALSSDASQSYGVAVNPEKSKPVAFGPKDRIILLAEN